MRSMRAFCSAARDAHDLQRQRDVALDRAPGKQRRRLEDIAIGALLARLLGRHAVDEDRAGGRLLQIGDDAQEVVLPQPDGPMKETNSPLRIVRSTSDSALTGPSLVWKVSPSFSAETTVAVSLSLSAAVDRCVAASKCRDALASPSLDAVLNFSTAAPARIRDARSSPMSASSKPTCRLVRPGETYDGKQGLSYFAGIAAETVGSHGHLHASSDHAARRPRQGAPARKP